jgi:hypothetical protein
MVSKLARGTYVLVVATMVTAWVVSFTREAPADPQQPDAALTAFPVLHWTIWPAQLPASFHPHSILC